MILVNEVGMADPLGDQLPRVAPPSPEARRAQGKALRERLNRADMGFWKPESGRPDPIETLKAAVAHRDPALLPIRWGRMAQSPFYFYRGNAALMAADIAPGPTTGLHSQLCGDAHIINFGAFGKPDGGLAFDLNDFDETCRGPWEWDLKRLLASAVLGGREAGHSETSCLEACARCVRAYAAGMDHFADLGIVALSREEIGPHNDRGALAPIFEKALRSTPEKLMEKAIDEGPRFKSKGPFLRPLTDEESIPFLASLAEYHATLGPARQQMLDDFVPACLGRRVAGCGSLGVMDVLVLCFGNGPRDPLFLEFKAQHNSVWTPYSSYSSMGHLGRWVAVGQHRMQTWADPFLGWSTVAGAPFVVKQWSDHKASIEVADLVGAVLGDYLELCGTVLAKAHARSGDPAMITGYLGEGGELPEALSSFAVRYADQATRDWEILKTAIAGGRLNSWRPGR